MYSSKLVLEYTSPSDFIDFVPISDVHYGSTLCDFDAFKKTVASLNTENRYWFLLGDIIDSIIVTDPRFDFRTTNVGDILLDHVETILDIISPFKDTCLGVLTGNHEDKLRRKCQIDISKYIAKQLNAPYMGTSALLYLSFRRNTHTEAYTMMLVHGGVNVNTRQGRIRKVEELATIADADIYVQAHYHDLLHTRTVHFSVNKAGKLVTREKVYVLSGGYLKAYMTDSDTSYVEQKLLKPLVIGTPVIRIYPEMRKIEVLENV